MKVKVKTLSFELTIETADKSEYVECEEVVKAETVVNTEKVSASDRVSETEEERLMEELTPFFYGNREKATEFVCSIKGQKPIVVSNLVKQLIKEKYISDLSAGKPLHSVLQKYGLYNATLRNWNERIK